MLLLVNLRLGLVARAVLVLVILISCCIILTQATSSDHIILIKIGGSSITDKAIPERINTTALTWFAKTLSSCENNNNNNNKFVIVHGAGSFGHFQAREYGLQGKTEAPPTSTVVKQQQDRNTTALLQYKMQGIARTRLSVQTLNRLVVSALMDVNLAAIGISPCFGIPHLQAHGGTAETVDALRTVVYETITAGLVPVLHGDACLYGTNDGGILSGDTLMEMLGTASWIHQVVFLTDVDGVYSSDPKLDASAVLLQELAVHADGSLQTSLFANQQQILQVTGSLHSHDVTGGLEVSNLSYYYYDMGVLRYRPLPTH